jgi:Ca2+-binding RTX toxin-like protein
MKTTHLLTLIALVGVAAIATGGLVATPAGAGHDPSGFCRSDMPRIEAREGRDTVGTSADEYIIGSPGADTIYGGGGHDCIHGNGGADVIRGGDGPDWIFGGEGADRMYGEGHDDELWTDSGKDHDQFDGGWGIDRISYVGEEVGVRITESVPGYATVDLEPSHRDTLIEMEWITGSNHADQFYPAEGARSRLIFAGAEGDDLFQGPVSTSRNARIELHGGGGRDRLDCSYASYCEIWGGSGDDDLRAGSWTFSGNWQPEGVVRGGDGNDTIVCSRTVCTGLGEGGDDRMFGGRYNEVLDGGLGNDVIDGDGGSDRLFGGEGDDTIDGGGGHANPTGLGGYVDSGDHIDGAWGNDTLRGGGGNDTIYGADGHDVIYGNGDVDTIDGGWGSDSIFGGPGSDRMFGGEGDDNLEGGDVSQMTGPGLLDLPLPPSNNADEGYIDYGNGQGGIDYCWASQEQACEDTTRRFNVFPIVLKP